MRITITGINFKYDDGYQEEYTGVELQHISSGFKFKSDSPAEVTKAEYEQNQSSTNGLSAE